MLESLKKNLINIPGRKLDRKFIVFESDDWGTIRMPGKAEFEALTAKGYVKENDPFSRYDTLESESDLAMLFEVLSKFKDIKGVSPVITANTVVCNPDFDKIEASGYKEYHHEPFTQTYKCYPEHAKSFELIKQGMSNGLYYPQFHAREHLNLPMWMELLQRGNDAFLYAFKLRCFSIDHKAAGNRRKNVMASYDYYSPESFTSIKDSIKEGLEIFEGIFNFKSQSSIAPCYVWDNKIEDVLFENKIKYLQGSRFQQVPVENEAGFKRKFHFNGEENRNKQRYFSRNGLFEPSLNTTIDWVDKCLESIEIAFRWKKPAIIGTHRLNFCGSIFPENRENNLKMLERLLKEVQRKWPDVEFVSTVGLAQQYNS